MQARLQASRILVAACTALIILLAASAVIQYRSSRRVAAADAQREREHLRSAASLFASEFNGMVSDVVALLESNASQAVKSGQKLEKLPRLIGELYYVDIDAQGRARVKRLAADGSFVTAAAPAWMTKPVCVLSVMERPPTLVVPIYEFSTQPVHQEKGIRYVRTFGGRLSRCFVAQMEEEALRTAILPQMIEKTFGKTAAREYAFAVLWRGQQEKAVYGAPLQADLTHPFFALRPGPVLFPEKGATGAGAQPRLRVQHFESTIVSRGSQNAQNLMDLFGTGIWELELAHKGEPLTAAFERAGKLERAVEPGSGDAATGSDRGFADRGAADATVCGPENELCGRRFTRAAHARIRD